MHEKVRHRDRGNDRDTSQRPHILIQQPSPARTGSVRQLLAFYKEVVLAARHMPKTLTETMEGGIQGQEERIRKAARFAKPWTDAEAAVLRGALTRFGKATEKLSRVTSAAFGGNLPVIRAVDSPEFELNHWQTRDPSPATARAVENLCLVRKVLDKLRRSES